MQSRLKYVIELAKSLLDCYGGLINLDAAGDVWNLEDGAYAAMGGESGGFVEIDWLRGIRDADGMGSSGVL